MNNEFITSFTMQEFITGLRLFTSLDNTPSIDTVLRGFNLSEFKDYNDQTLKDVNSTMYVYLYFAPQRNEKDINGTIAQVFHADKYLELMVLGVNNLAKIYNDAKKDGFFLTDKFKNYIDYIKSQNNVMYSYSTDQQILKSDALLYMVKNFAEPRNFLLEKGEAILKKSAVVLSVKVQKNLY